MIQISKRSLALIIIASILIGSMGVLCAARGGVGGSVILSGEEYNYMDQMVREYGKVDNIKSFLLENYYVQVDEDELMNSIYDGLVGGLNDIYSEYIPSDEYAAYLESLFGTETYYGVGITFVTVPVEGGYYSTAVNTKGPAYAAGVRKGDIISYVDGVDALTVDGDTLRDMIRGELDTEVTIGLIRGDTPYEITIKRQEIPVESVVYEYLEDENIAYIQITQFIGNTGDDFKEALAKAEAFGADGLVIDLRDNGGGLVEAAIEVADQIMEQGIVVSTLDHNGNKESYTTSKGRTALPYAVLVNGNTASSSEILSAGIQDNEEGIIIGTLTYGKGIIQNVVSLSDGSAVKYTELQFLSPNGNQIHGEGITPDIIIDLDESCYNENGFLENDVQLNKAIEVLRESK